jgi:triosephosphate isomerase
MRRPFVAGNWKMNLNLARGRELVAAIRAGLPAGDKADVAVCPPAVYVAAMVEAARGSTVAVGAQDLYHEAEGAYTGEVSAAMLTDVGAKYVIIGHSERRHTIGHLEDDHMINLKVKAAIAGGLVPILCIGETLAERKSGQTLDVLTFQLVAGLVGVKLTAATQLVVAYEPVWAIGTGQVATPAQAQEAHAHVRKELKGLYGATADGIRILYGGSVKADNAAEIMQQPDVDGGLIGGASLKADAFLPIVAAAVASVG